MQKKVLIPVLMAVPAAFPAMADIDMGFPVDNWKQGGTTGDDNQINPETKEFSCVVGTGFLEQELSLPRGKYKLVFKAQDNVKVLIGADKSTADVVKLTTIATESIWYAEFEVSSEKTYIKITGANPEKGFSFTGKELVLVFNENAAVTNLQTQLGQLNNQTLFEVAEADYFEEAETLRNQLAKIRGDLASYNGTPFETVWSEIGSIGGTASTQKAIEIYKNYGLDQNPSAIEEYLTALGETIKSYNDAVLGENATWQVYLDNVAARGVLLTEQATLATNIASVQTDITGWKVVEEDIKKEISDKADALAEEIAAYKTKIETDYPLDTNPEALRHEIKFESETQKPQGKIDRLRAEFTALVDNYDTYYNVNYLLITKLEEAYRNYCDAVNSALGIRGYETVYDGLKDTLTEDADGFYNKIKAENTIPDVETANAYNAEKKCSENIENAIAKFAADTEEYNTMVETQNANMTTALGQLGQFDGSVNEFDGLLVPDQFMVEFDKKLREIRDAVYNLRNYVDDEYSNQTLEVNATSEYGTQVANIQSLIDDMNQFIQPFAVINNLMDALDKAKDEIKKISDKTAGLVENKVDIYSKFEGNFTAFEEAIRNLDAESSNDNATVDELIKRIEKSVTNAQSMSDYFIKAYRTINGYQTSLNDLVTFVQDKKIDSVEAVKVLKEGFYTIYTKNEGGQFAKAIADLWGEYSKAAQGDPNSAFDLIQELCDETLKNSTLEADMNKALVEFLKSATDANFAWAEGKVDELVKAWDDAKEAGTTNIDDVNVSEVQQELGTIQTDINAAKNLPSPMIKLAQCDNRIENLLVKIDNLNKQIKGLMDNQKAYDDLVILMNGLQEQLDEVSEYNESNSMEPGKSYYKDTVIPAIQAKIDKLNNTDLPASLENGTVIRDRDAENGYQDQVEALEKEISDTRIAIENNNTAHNNHLAREKEVRTYIENLIAEINGNTNAADLSDVKTWLTTLNSLIDNDLNDVNIMVTNSYGKGKSFSDNKEIMDAYQAIYDKANKIDKKYHGDEFHQAVVEANKTTTAGWDQILSGLWDQYKDGIGTYNIFYYDIKNPGWKAFVIAAVERHATLFDFYGIITALTEEETAAVAKWNEENHVITADEWQEWLDRAAGVSSDITKDVNGLLAETDALAEKYYGELEPRAAGAINDAEILLNNAGISLDNLDEARFNHDQAVNIYTSVKEHVSFKMDEIATYLDKVFDSIHLQEYAENAWVVRYDEAQKEITELRDEINGYKHAQPEVRDAALQGFANIVETIVALNNEVTAVKEGLIDRYKTDAESLEELLNVLRSYRDEVKKSDDLNVEDQTLQNNFDNVWLPGMNEAYEALREYCETLGGCASMETLLGQIRNDIDVISNLVANYGGRLVELNLEDRYNSVMTSINDAYKTAFNNEVTYLRQLLKDTKVAFNDAVKYKGVLPEGETFDGVDVDITELNSKIEVLRYNESKKDALHDEALGYENELCRLYVMLQSSWGNNESPAAAILNGLNGRYDAIAQAIASGEELLGGCMDSVKTEFAGKYGELKAALDAEKSDWSDDGDHILARETYYTNALDEIEAEVKALTENIKVAEEAAQAEYEKQKVSNERYDVLKAELDDLNKQFVDAKALVESYGEDIAEMYSTTANYIEKELGKMSEKLEADKAGYLLTAGSELENAGAIEGLINDYKLNATREYAGDVLKTTGQAAANASDKLKDLDIVPAQRKVLVEQYNEANDEYQALLVEKRNADFERLGEIITRAGELAEIFNSISDNAVANSFVPGDVDLDENGEVNVLDVQMLISMIGKGVTYQELYEENPRQACAADVTGNENLNVADVTALIQIILGDDFNVVKVRAHKPAAKVDGGLSLTLAEEGDGVRRYALMLNGGVPFTGGQFDIRVSGTANVTAVATSGRTESHDAYLFDRGLGDYRVVLASMENRVFEGNEGVIVYIDVEGEGELTVENALFSDTNNIEHEMGRAHTSAVDAIIDYCKDGAKRIYDAAGRTFNSLQKGINIIINKDGSVKKELRK